VIWIRILAAARRAAPHRNTSWVCVRPTLAKSVSGHTPTTPSAPFDCVTRVRVLTATHRSTCVRASHSSHPLTDDCKRDGRSLKQQRPLVSRPAAVALCGVGRRHTKLTAFCCVVSLASHNRSTPLTELAGDRKKRAERQVCGCHAVMLTHSLCWLAVTDPLPHPQRHSVEVGALTVTNKPEKNSTDPLFPRQWLFWFWFGFFWQRHSSAHFAPLSLL
jgi:hypothetical protein